MIGGAKGIGIGIDFGIPNQYCRATSKPYIEKDVLDSLRVVASAYGKSNNDSDRAIIKNLVDPDNPFIISNAAFKLNSGFGKYEEDFTDWRIYPNIKVTDSVVTTDGNFKSSWFIYKHSSESKINEMNIKVSGIPKGGKILYFYISDETANLPILYTIPKDGIYHLPESKINNNRASVGFTVESSYDWNNIRIEQIPSFEGAFVTDGVDDLIKSTKSATEMLDGSNKVTVVSMIHQIKTNDDLTRNNWFFTPVSYLENRVVKDKIGKTGIYGYTSTNVTNAQISDITPILGDKNDYTLYSKIEDGDRDYFTVEGFQNQGIWYVSSIAWYWTIIANKVLTTDQINQVIAYYNLDRCVEPTVWYDVQKQGLSNDTPDSDWYLKDYSGNGYDMTLYNYAKTPESGINEDGGLQSDGVDDYGKVTGLPIYKDYTVVADYERLKIGYIEDKGTPAILSKSYTAGQGAFLMNLISSTGEHMNAYTFGNANSAIFNDLSKKIYYQSKYKMQGFDMTIGSGVDGDSLWLGVVRDNDSRFFNGAIYSLMSFPYSMSEFLIERQLKKHKLGTLYPNMMEFRPIVKSNLPYSSISYSVNPGEYISVDSMVTITVTLPNTSDELMEVSCNAISDISISGDNGVYEITGKIVKSPQKINLVISSYLTMLNNETLISNETLIKNE